MSGPRRRGGPLKSLRVQTRERDELKNFEGTDLLCSRMPELSARR